MLNKHNLEMHEPRERIHFSRGIFVQIVVTSINICQSAQQLISIQLILTKYDPTRDSVLSVNCLKLVSEWNGYLNSYSLRSYVGSNKALQTIVLILTGGVTLFSVHRSRMCSLNLYQQPKYVNREFFVPSRKYIRTFSCRTTNRDPYTTLQERWPVIALWSKHLSRQRKAQSSSSTCVVHFGGNLLLPESLSNLNFWVVASV